MTQVYVVLDEAGGFVSAHRTLDGAKAVVALNDARETVSWREHVSRPGGPPDSWESTLSGYSITLVTVEP